MRGPKFNKVLEDKDNSLVSKGSCKALSTHLSVYQVMV